MLKKILCTALFFALTGLSALAADFNGKWTADFQTQIGEQKYTYEFHVDGAKLTGKATNGMGTTDIAEGKIDGDNITFVENLNYQGNEIKITYTGKIDGDQIKFTRQVGDFATEEILATRAK
jgi:hypothetical protein